MKALRLQVPLLPPGRVPALDELKGIAILLIVLYHAGGVLVWNNYLHGDIGVDMFIILSGLGLTLGDKGPVPWREFMGKRLLRIMPTYWIALTAFLWFDIKFLGLSHSWWNILSHYLGLHCFLGTGPAFAINNSFWFITLIILLYAGYGTFRALLDAPDNFILATALVSSGTALLLFFTNESGLMGHVGFRVPDFFIGMLIGRALKTGMAIALVITLILSVELRRLLARVPMLART